MPSTSKLTLPRTVSVPIELPGATMPPPLTLSPPMEPVPVSVAPEQTHTVETSEPFTLRTPSLTVVVPV
jgi:hypothetical protein